MKVEVLPGYQYQMNKLTPKTTSTEWKSGKFTQMMDEMKVQETEKNEPVLDMLENVQEITEILERDLTLANLNEYKSALRAYLNHYVKNELKKETQEMHDLNVYKKRITTVRSVEEKLEGITEKLLDSHKGHFEMLQRIGEVQGLILSLYA